MSEPIRKLSEAELEEQKANKVRQVPEDVLSSSSPEVVGVNVDKGFKVIPPSAIEGGGKPSEVDGKTKQAIKEFVASGQAVSADLMEHRPEVRGKALLDKFAQDNLNGPNVGTNATNLMEYLNDLEKH